MPFSLDKLVDVPRYIYQGSFMTNCDNKSGHVDDRLNGELLTCTGPWSRLLANRSKEYWLQAAGTALFAVLSVLVELSNTIGIKKSVLTSTTALEYLGLVFNLEKLCFLIPQCKIESFAALREEILAESIG